MMIKKYIYCTVVVASFLLTACVFRRPEPGVVAELGSNRLTEQDMAVVTALAKDSADSAAMAHAYIQQWAEEILEYQYARDHASTELESLVESYRRSLYVHQYEEDLVARHCPKSWPDSAIRQVYEQQQSKLVLHENILKGVFVVLPKGTPQLAKFQQRLSRLAETDMEPIEKYAYHYATGYELFVDEWRTGNQLLLRLPLEENTLDSRLRSNNMLVVEDSVSIYLLRVTEKHFSGEIMPISYAKDQINDYLRSRWQVAYLVQHRKKIYQDAIRFNKLKIYEE